MFGSDKKSALEQLRSQWGKTKDTSFNFYQIATFFARNTHLPGTHVLSQNTISALDFSALFEYLDRTVSRVGQQWLFNRLASYRKDEDFHAFESSIKHAADNEQEKLEAQLALSRLQHENAYGICVLFFDAYPKPPRFLPLIRAQAIASVIFVIATFIYPALIVPLVLWLALNTSIHYYYKGYIQQFTYAMDQLAAMTRTVSDLSQLSFPYRAKAEVSGALKSIRQITNSWTILGERASSDVGDLGWLLKEYIKIAFLIEPILFFRVIGKLADRKDDVRTLFEYVGFIDGCLSVLSVRQSSTTCMPVQATASKGTLTAEDMVHPLIKNCQPNSWQIMDRSLLITGSNMSGKSAFIRTVAINVLCAHTINTCFARAFATSFFRVYAVMNISDDLLQGKSYYMEEVLSIRQLVEESEQENECLFLLDEIFRGTNTTERIAAAASVLSFLNKKNIAIVATHDSELTQILNDTFELYHFSESFDGNAISFDYILKSGRLQHGNAIRILKMSGYPAEVIERATELTKTKS